MAQDDRCRAGEDNRAEVVIGIETDRASWAQALIVAAARFTWSNPLQASRYRERSAVSGAKCDAADAYMLADVVRTDSHQLRPSLPTRKQSRW
ncbi:transposase [Streptomyces sp. NPDC004539]|uniref:IS110 family transposase n=1 Tax=Streptomyces sp. NPDC004539 TaxID=3154280 RepID=UPI0033B615F6